MIKLEVYRPNVKVTSTVHANKNANDFWVLVDSIDLTEKYMDKYAEIVGNGLSKVYVSSDFGNKEFGKGPSTMVSVGLTCNQDEDTIGKAIDLAGIIARNYAAEQLNLAQQEFDKLISESKPQATAFAAQTVTAPPTFAPGPVNVPVNPAKPFAFPPPPPGGKVK